MDALTQRDNSMPELNRDSRDSSLPPGVAKPTPSQGGSSGSHVDTAYFDGLYETTDDPWHMETRWYEARKRDLLCNVLPRPRYRRVFEPGCGAGLLTQALAPRCDAMIVGDLHDRAVAAAKLRMASHEHVEVCKLDIAQAWPEGRFDLIVVSELGYYFEPASWLDIAHRLYASLTQDGTLLACHWRHDFDARVTPTAFVHDTIRTAGVLYSQCMHDEPDFLLEVWTRNPTSIAQYEQLR